MTSISAQMSTVSHTSTSVVASTTVLGFKVVTSSSLASSSKITSITSIPKMTTSTSSIPKLTTLTSSLTGTKSGSSGKSHSSAFSKGSSFGIAFNSNSAWVKSTQTLDSTVNQIVWVIETSSTDNAWRMATTTLQKNTPNRVSSSAILNPMPTTTLPAVYYYAGKGVSNTTSIAGNRTTTTSPFATQTSSSDTLKFGVLLLTALML